MNRNPFAARPLVFLLVSLAIAAATSARGDADDQPADKALTVVTVQTGALKLATLHRYIPGFGAIEPAPAATNAPAADVMLAAPVAGVVTKVSVIEGQHVEKGEELMELNSGTTTYENAAQQLERQKNLYAQQNTSLKNLQDAQAQLALLRVVAPMSGTAIRVNAKPGQAVDLTAVVVEVMDLDRLIVSAPIPAREARALRPGDSIEVLTDPPITAALSYINPMVDTNNDTILTRAPLPPASGCRPGQFVPVRIVAETHTNTLAAPIASVVTDQDGQSTLALVHGEEAAQTNVQTGLREEGWVEIIAPGLKPGDTVVTVGAYSLPDKTKIRLQNPSNGDTNAAPAHDK